MTNLVSDLINFLKFQKENNINIGFFCENKNIFEYLKPYILKKSKNKKIIIISFEKIDLNLPNVLQFVFLTNFFREIVFLTLRLKYLYSSTPGLNFTLFKKTKFSKCKYVYLQHSLCSMTMIYSKNAFNKFDGIQAVTNYQFEELNEIKKVNKLKLKIFKSNYLFLKEKYLNYSFETKKNILIAPTWNTNFYDTDFFYDLIDILRHNKIFFTLRPHPMSLKKNEINLNKIETMNLKIDKDTVPNFNKYNFLLSDWSGIFIEYIYLKKRKPIFFETQKKKLNKNYENFFKNKPAEEFLREKFGVIFNLNQLDEFINVLNGKDDYFDLSKKEAEIKNFFY